MSTRTQQTSKIDLSIFPDTPPDCPLHLLFIHHSCGGQLFAAPGPDSGTNCIYKSHPNGGNLRARLEQSSYVAHEASYCSRVGHNTDLFDWLPKFRNQMEEVLACDFQDVSYKNGSRNQIVAFKSCFPNNAFVSEGMAPGNIRGPDLTLWNAKATYSALLDEFRKWPDVLFVCLTAPPLAPKVRPQSTWRRIVNSILGQKDTRGSGALLAREFNNWLVSADGWLGKDDLVNTVVFDYFDILTDYGKSNFTQYPTAMGYDSHPSRAGNEKAATAFIPFLNRAVRRARLVR